MTKIYNKIELVGSWDCVQTIVSRERIDENKLLNEIIKPILIKFSDPILSSLISHMETDKINDLYFYKFEFQITRQKQKSEYKNSKDENKE